MFGLIEDRGKLELEGTWLEGGGGELYDFFCCCPFGESYTVCLQKAPEPVIGTTDRDFPDYTNSG